MQHTRFSVTCSNVSQAYISCQCTRLYHLFILVSPLGTVEVTPDVLQASYKTVNVTFTCRSDAGPNLIYTWLYNDVTPADDVFLINGNELTGTYTLPEGTYTCVVSNEAGNGTDSSFVYGK